MKDKLDNIEDLFRENLEHFEADVDPNVWSNISSQIGQTAPVQDPSSSLSGSAGSAGTAASSGIVKLALVAGTAGVLSVGSYMYFSEDEMSNENQISDKTELIESTPEVNEASSEFNELKSSETKMMDDFTTTPQEKVVIQEKTSNDDANINEAQANVPAQQSTQQAAGHTAATEVVIADAIKKSTPTATKAATNSGSQSNNEPADVASNEASQPLSHFEASIYASTEQGVYPLTIQFENRGSHSDDITWTFGDKSFVSKETNIEHTYEKSGNYWVYLEIKNDLGQVSKDSVFIVVKGKAVLNAPNIFTPNGDGYNDAFVIETKDVKDLNCKILDRTGRIIYEWNNIHGHWDGKDMNNAMMPNGTYMFVVTAVDIDGNPIAPIKGTVMLTR